MTELILIYATNLVQLIVPVFLLLIFIWEIICLLLKKRTLKETFINFLMFLIGGALSIGVIVTIGNMNSDYNIVQKLFINKEPLQQYVPMSKDVEELTALIKEKYGIDVYVNVDPNEIHGSSGYAMTFEVTEEEAIEKMQCILNAVNLYNEDALRWMPDKFYIVSTLNAEDSVAGINSSQGYVFHSYDYIVLATTANEEVVHHEIMHSLDIYMDPEDILKMINEKETGCSLVSEYACTNYYEFMADSWEYSFERDDNEYFRLMRSYYPRFLKGFDTEENCIIDSSFEGGNEYLNLSEGAKKVYQALYNILPGESFTVSADWTQTKEGRKAFEIDHPECLYFYDTMVVSDGEKTVISLEKTMGTLAVKKSVEINSLITEELNAYQGINSYDQLLSIYQKISSCYNSEEVSGSLETFSKENPNILLRYYLYRLGYSSSLEKEENLPEAVIIRMEDNYYWLVVTSEPEDSDFIYSFLVSDDVYEFGKDYSNSWHPCEDMSMSYAAKKELYLSEYNESRIDSYLIKVFYRPKENRNAYIYCADDKIADAVIEYVLKENWEGYTRFAQLWFDNISYNAPGFTYTEKGQGSRLVAITDFAY